MTAKIKLNAASGGGSFSLQAPSSSANNRVFTLPDSADATILTSTASLGKHLQTVTVSTQTRTTVSSSTGTYFAVSGLSANITPSASSSKILIIASSNYYIIGGTSGGISIFRGGSTVAPAAASGVGRFTVVSHTNTAQGNWAIHHLDSPNSTSQLTYDIRMARLHGSDNFYIPADPSYQPAILTLIEVGV